MQSPEPQEAIGLHISGDGLIALVGSGQSQLLSEAKTAYKQGQYPQALELFEQLRDYPPYQPIALAYMATSQQHMGNWTIADRLISQALHLSGEQHHPELIRIKANGMVGLGQPQAAIDLLDQGGPSSKATDLSRAMALNLRYEDQRALAERTILANPLIQSFELAAQISAIYDQYADPQSQLLNLGFLFDHLHWLEQLQLKLESDLLVQELNRTEALIDRITLDPQDYDATQAFHTQLYAAQLNLTSKALAKYLYLKAIQRSEAVGLIDYQWYLGAAENESDPTIQHQLYTLALESAQALPVSRRVKADINFMSDLLIRSYLKDTSNQENTDKILNVNAKRQLITLKDWLNCDEIEIRSIYEQGPDQTAIITVMELQNELYGILSLPDSSGNLVHQRPIPIDQRVLDSATVLMRQLQTDPTIPASELEIHSQNLYRDLIQPLQIPEGINLHFVLGGILQNIPMAMVKGPDGKYLIENHAITQTAIPYKLAQKSHSKNSSVIAFGLSEIAPSFSPGLQPLPGVTLELEIFNQSKNIIHENRDFTSQTFAQPTEHRIVHIATHGQVSSDPEQTYLFAHDRKLTNEDISNLVRARAEDGITIDLLTLSACRTAQGDGYAALGLGGLALQSGAQNVLASLWAVNDGSTASLMRKFYQGLEAGLGKAEALQQAQKFLIEKGFDHPYYWSAFVLG
jgi:CHAT domain-containing protein